MTARGNVARAPWPIIVWFPQATVSLTAATSGDGTTGARYPPGDVQLAAADVGQPWSGRLPNDQQLVVTTHGDVAKSNAWTPPGTLGIAADVEGGPNTVPLYAGTGFEVRVYDVANPSNLLAYVPNPISVQFEDDLSDVGSAQIVISTLDVPDTVYGKDHIWRISWEGVERFAFIAEQVQDNQVNSDGSVRSRTIAGKGIAQWLDKIKIYPSTLASTNQPTRSFKNVSYASLFQTLLGEASKRWTAAGLTFPVTQYLWNDKHDSEGVAWTDTHQLQVNVGDSMLTTLQNFAASVPFDWHMDSRFNLALTLQMGTDKSATVAINPAGSISSAQVTTDYTALWDVYLVQDANSNYSEQSDAPTVASYGRREQFASSATVVDSTGRADLGHTLLKTSTIPSVQKVMQTAAYDEGRKPYVDFQIGDFISAEFVDGTILKTRVIGIGLQGDQNSPEQSQVILDFDFGKKKDAATSSSGTGAYNGPVMVFADTGNAVWTITNQYAYPISLTLTTSGVSAVTCNSYIHGVASAACVIQADILINHAIIRTMKETLAAGEHTWCPNFVIPSLPDGDTPAQLRLSVSAGNFVIQPYELQHWYLGQGLQGGIQTGDASMFCTDSLTIPTIGIADKPPIIQLQTPLQAPAHKIDSFSPMYIGITDIDNAWIINRAYNPTVNDDNDRNSSGSWLNTSNDLEVGNDGLLTWDSAMHFLIPAPSFTPGTTITHAFVTYINDENDNNAQIIIRAEKSASPTPVTSNADFTSRLSNLTTAQVNWAPGSVIANQTYQTADFSTLIMELIGLYGSTITGIQLFFLNNASPLNGKLLMRSKENSANTPPILTVRFTT